MIHGFKNDRLAFMAAQDLGLTDGSQANCTVSMAKYVADFGWIYRSAHNPDGGGPLGKFVVDSPEGPIVLEAFDERLDLYDVF